VQGYPKELLALPIVVVPIYGKHLDAEKYSGIKFLD